MSHVELDSCEGSSTPPKILAAFIALAMACGTTDEGHDATDGGPRPDRAEAPSRDPWTFEVIDEGSDVGLHVRHVVDPAGASHVAYYRTRGEVRGPCWDDPSDTDIPAEVRWALRYASDAAGGFRVEDVTEVLSPTDPPGLSLALDGTRPLVAALTGGPVRAIFSLCQAHDLGLFSPRSGSWSVDVVVEESGQAATALGGSDFGTVVGHWPAVAVGPEGQLAVAYKDVHNGSIQTDDLKRADLELAIGREGSWRHVAVDPGRGAGSHTRAAFDVRGRLVLAFVNPVEQIGAVQQGLWVVRTTEPLGAGAPAFEEVLIEHGPIRGAPALAIRGSLVHVLFYEATRGVPRLVELVDDAAFADLDRGWRRAAIGDARFDEGQDPTLAFDADGRLGAAWFRCRRASAGLGACDDESGLVFAWRDGDSWERERLTRGREECGRSPALAFGPAGDARVAFHCLEDRAEQVRMARREPL